tara:strand:- start:394 stop:726 length:333 start_codon:yes stop_codon:yes gene_type:complete
MLELKSFLKIKSAIRASYAKNKVATVIHSGDDDNGSILLKIRRKDSKSCLMGKSLSNDGSYTWSLLSECKNEWQEEDTVNEKIHKELRIDPDLWVLELESDTLWNPLEVS